MAGSNKVTNNKSDPPKARPRALSSGRPSLNMGLVITPGGAIKEPRKKRPSTSSAISTTTHHSTTNPLSMDSQDSGNQPDSQTKLDIQAIPPSLDLQLEALMEQLPPAVDSLDGEDVPLGEENMPAIFIPEFTLKKSPYGQRSKHPRSTIWT